jgi:hypothetical protein
MPKTPDELREQLEAANEDQPAEGKDRTAEGLEVERPSRGDFFSSLEKVARSKRED